MNTIADRRTDLETVRVRVFLGGMMEHSVELNGVSPIGEALDLLTPRARSYPSVAREPYDEPGTPEDRGPSNITAAEVPADSYESRPWPVPHAREVVDVHEAGSSVQVRDSLEVATAHEESSSIEVSDSREVNQYMRGLQRASAVLTPVALLLSWHFELRAAGLTERLAELYTASGANDLDWSNLTTLEQSARDAGAAARAWSAILNLSAGALVATVAHRLVRADRVPSPAEFFRGVWAKLRRRWRIHQLLAARHRAEVATGTFMMAILLTVFAIAFAYIGMQLSTAYGLRFIEPALYFIGWLFFIGANVLAGRATSLASRVAATWGFGDVLRFITAATMFGIETVISLAIIMINAALLAD